MLITCDRRLLAFYVASAVPGLHPRHRETCRRWPSGSPAERTASRAGATGYSLAHPTRAL